MAKVTHPFKAGERVWANGPNGYEIGTLVSNARLEGRSVRIDVALDSGSRIETSVKNVHRETPAFLAWQAAFAAQERAYRTLTALCLSKGYTFEGAAARKTAQWRAYDTARSAVSKIGAAVLAEHPYWH